MTPNTWCITALIPALNLLPTKLDTPAARALLIAIGLQESRLKHRKQVNGPARGYLQFETGGVAGVLNHHAIRDMAQEFCDDLDYPVERDANGKADWECVKHIQSALEHNDVLAAGLGRLNLFWLPQPLPMATQAWEGWNQYIAAWNPGKPHLETWANFYEVAWDYV